MKLHKLHKLNGSNREEYIVYQTIEDIDKLSHPLEGKLVGESALWIMSAYHSVLYKDSGTTFGEVKGVFIDEEKEEAGFVFEDQDVGERFRVTVTRED